MSAVSLLYCSGSNSGSYCVLQRPPPACHAKKRRSDGLFDFGGVKKKPAAVAATPALPGVSAALAEQELRLLGIRLPMPSKSKLRPPLPPLTTMTTAASMSAAVPVYRPGPTSSEPTAEGDPNGQQPPVCFGRALHDQPTSEVPGLGPVPTVLAASCDYLLNHLEVEGLFRVEGSKVRLRDLRQRLERGCGIREGTPPHDVCSSLKAWLRELPEPLVPARMAHALAEVAAGGQAAASPERRVRVLRLCGLLLPAGQLRALQHLCHFLGQVSLASLSNRMDAFNLATCLGPSLLHGCRPGPPAVACPRELARLNCGVALLIEHPVELGRWPAGLLHHQHPTQHHQQLHQQRQQQPLTASCDSGSRRRRSSGSIGGALKAVGRAVSRLASRSRSRSPGQRQQQQHQRPPGPSPSPPPPSVRRLLHRLSAGSAGRRVAAATPDDLLPPPAPPRKPPPPLPLPLLPSESASTPPPPLPPLSTLPSASALRTPMRHHSHHMQHLQHQHYQSLSPAPAVSGPLRAVHHLPALAAARAAAAAAAAAASGFAGTPARAVPPPPPPPAQQQQHLTPRVSLLV